MANNTQLNTNVTSGDTIATEDIAGVKHELVKVEFGADGIATKVSATDPLPVTTGGLTDTELRATPVPVSGTVTVDTSTLATSAKQDTGNSSLSSILAKIITAPATEAKQDIGNTSVSSIDTKLSSQATAAKQDTGNTSLGSIDTKLSSQSTAAKQDTGNTSLASIDGKLTNPLPVSGTVTANTGLTQPLTDAQLRATPVPVSGTVSVDTTGLATSAKQDTGNTSLGSIDTKLTSQATASKQDTGNTSLASIDTKLTNPLPVSAASLPLPSLAATSTKQSDGSQKTQVVDGSGNVIGATSNALDINIKSGNPTTITATQATGTNLHTVVDSGTITTVSTVTAVTAISNALPAGNNNIGDVDIATIPSLVAGTALIGKVGIDQTTPGTTNNVTSKDIPDAASTYALTNVSSTAYETGHILKGSPGYLFMLTGYNSKTSSQFIQLHNTTTVPADTAVPILIFIVPASSNFSLDLGKYGRYFSTGISICNSSTGPTKTIGSADCWFDAQVI